MHFFLTVSFILISFSSLSAQNYTAIDAHARNTKAPRSHKVEDLALSLSAPCKTEKERVRAFYVWIADNIRYDISTFQQRKEIDPEERQELQMPQQVIKRKKAICMGYTNLLNDLCKSVGIKTIFVSGMSKNATGRVSRTAHAWSLVLADGEWGLIDATWGSGNVDIEEEKYTEMFKEEYFWTSPRVFIENHFPDDPLFQLLPTPLTFEAFEKAEKPKDVALPTYAHIGDSLNLFIGMDSLNRYWNAGNRLLKFDPQGNPGFYYLGRFHYYKSQQYQNKLSTYYDEVRTNPQAFNQNWCDNQNENLSMYETSLTAGLEILKKATKNDRHAKNILSLKNYFVRASANIDRERETLKKNCDQLKRKQGRG